MRGAVIAAVVIGFGGLSNVWLGGAHASMAPAVDSVGFPERTQTISVAHVAGKPLEVRTIDGAIDIHAGGKESVSITAKIQAGTEERLAKIKVKAERDERGALVINVEWPGGKAEPADGASFDVKIPDAVGVTAVTTNGAINLAGVGGPATLETSNGSVEVRGHDGPVHAVANNGRIKASDVTGAVDATTGNGAVDVLDVGGATRTKTTNGATTVRTTAGNTGPVHVQTSNGAVTLEVGAAFGGELTAKTSIGAMTIEPPTGAKVIENTGKTARVRFAAAGEGSSLTTSIGAITVRARPDAK